MFYVDFDPKINNKENYEIRYINNAVVTVEPPRKVNDIVQCQQFGHTQAYCRKPFRCTANKSNKSRYIHFLPQITKAVKFIKN